MPLFVGCLALVASVFLPSSDVLPVKEPDRVLSYDIMCVNTDSYQSRIDNITLGEPITLKEKTATKMISSTVAVSDEDLNNLNSVKAVAVEKQYDKSWAYVKQEEQKLTKLADSKKLDSESRKKILSDPKEIIREVALSNNCTESEIVMLLEIARRESSFVIDAKSPSGYCVGLFQLSKDKGTYAQRVDPVWNTNKAISYMKDRYGSIYNAYKFRKANNWY